MNKIDSSQLLSQLRVAASQARGMAVQPSEETSSDKFSSLLTQSIGKVNEMQKTSSSMAKAFEMGDPNITLPEVMIAKNKAGLAFEGMVQVRNKVVEAYREVMRMQV